MLERNTMQYGSDGFEFRRQALLKSRQPLDFTYETSVTSLQIAGTEPEGCSRRVIFEIDGQLYTFVNGLLDVYDDREDVCDILKYGNTVAELLALNADSLASLVGKRVYPIIALDAPANSTVMPTIKISARVNSYNDVYTVTRYSPVYELKCASDACKISDISANKTLNGYGTATIRCKLKNPITGWSDDWINLEDAQYQLATAVQFQVTYLVTTLDGSDFAQVLNITTRYTTDADKLSGDVTEIVTVPSEYYSDLGICYALIKTGELLDCDLRAFVTFSAPAEHREILIGNSTGSEQTVTLVHNDSVERNIVADTLQMTYDNKPLLNFFYDTQNSTLTFTAPFGTVVRASYDAGANNENWREMALDFQTEVDGVTYNRFIYRTGNAASGSVSAVKFRFEKKSGAVADEWLGSGTGREQTFCLPNHAKAENVQCTGAYKYDEPAQILKAVVPLDEDVSVSYEWIGEIPAVKEYAVGWCAR